MPEFPRAQSILRDLGNRGFGSSFSTTPLRTCAIAAHLLTHISQSVAIFLSSLPTFLAGVAALAIMEEELILTPPAMDIATLP